MHASSLSTGANNLVPATMDGRPSFPSSPLSSACRPISARKQNYLTLNGRALLEMTRGAPFILNPGSDYGKELLPEEIASLLDPDRMSPSRSCWSRTQVLIGQPPSIHTHWSMR